MIKATDIVDKIQSEFGDNADEVVRYINKELLLDECLNRSEIFIGNRDRIIRCIIYMANKNMNDLVKYVFAAKEDPRDVIFWAEYEILVEKQEAKRIRDFNKPFCNHKLIV